MTDTRTESIARIARGLRGRVIAASHSLWERLCREAGDRNTWVRSYVIVGIAVVFLMPATLTTWAGQSVVGEGARRLNVVSLVLSVVTSYLFFAWLGQVRKWRDRQTFFKGRVAIIPFTFDFLRTVLNLPDHMNIKMVGEVGDLTKQSGTFGIVVEGKYIAEGQVLGKGHAPLVMYYRELAEDEYPENAMRRLKLVRIDGLDT